MLISHLLIGHKVPAPRFAPGLFIGLIAVFAILGQSRPVVGLAGIGTILIITGTLIELNRQRIWENYRKAHRKQKGVMGIWTKPNMMYYRINVLFLWPLIIFIGAVCVWAAYALA